MITFIKDILNTAFISLWTRKLRTILSILGIVIGILTVSALLTVALGVKNEVKKSIGDLGANLMFVLPGSIEGGNFASQAGASTITELDVATIKSSLSQRIKNMSVATLLSGNVRYSSQSMSSALIFAASPGITDALDLELSDGRVLQDFDESTKNRFAVIGDTTREKLFGSNVAVGQKIQIRNEEFTVVGVLKKESSGMNFGGPDFNSLVIVPLETGWDIAKNRQIFRIFIQANESENVEDMKESIKQVMLQNHGGEEDFSVLTQDDLLEVINKILNLVTSMLSAIAAISLIVGGIGIMNTMLVSVSERTREIGIRKSVGATRGDIMFQFLVESIMLTLIGGLVAILIFSIIILAASSKSPIPLDLDWRVIGGAVIFSVVVGIVFGVFPAYQASKKDPIVALKYE